VTHAFCDPFPSWIDWWVVLSEHSSATKWECQYLKHIHPVISASQNFIRKMILFHVTAEHELLLLFHRWESGSPKQLKCFGSQWGILYLVKFWGLLLSSMYKMTFWHCPVRFHHTIFPRSTILTGIFWVLMKGIKCMNKV
jgi:hypothetical protein